MNFTGERFIPGLSGWLSLQHYHRYFFVINKFDLKEKVIVDIACGEGYGSEILSNFSKTVYGIDNSKEVIDHATIKYKKSNLSFIVGSAAMIPLPSNSVDLVVSFETIEHHDKHDEMMREVKRVLKVNGFLIISSPDKGFYERNLPNIKNEFHIKELYREEFQSLIKKYFNYTHFFIQNNIVGSFIASEQENCNYSRPIHIDNSKADIQTIEPRFNLSVSSDIEFGLNSSISICTPSYNYDIYALINELKCQISQNEEILFQIKASFYFKSRMILNNFWKIIKRQLKRWLQ